MIRVSTRVLYGLRAIVYMGINKDKWPISLKEISVEQNIPLRYIEQIFIRFRKAGIVKSFRGVNGGYVLRDNFEQISLLDVVEAADGKISLAWCLTPSSKRRCPVVEDCVIAHIWSELGKNIRSYLSKISLGEIMEKARDTNLIQMIQNMGVGRY